MLLAVLTHAEKNSQKKNNIVELQAKTTSHRSPLHDADVLYKPGIDGS